MQRIVTEEEWNKRYEDGASNGVAKKDIEIFIDEVTRLLFNPSHMSTLEERANNYLKLKDRLLSRLTPPS